MRRPGGRGQRRATGGAAGRRGGWRRSRGGDGGRRTAVALRSSRPAPGRTRRRSRTGRPGPARGPVGSRVHARAAPSAARLQARRRLGEPLDRIAWAVGPVNGGSPASISYSTDAERVQVGPGVELVARRLLGAHVGRRPDRETGLGQPVSPPSRAARCRSRRRACCRRGQHDVLRLDVPVDHAVLWA